MGTQQLAGTIAWQTRDLAVELHACILIWLATETVRSSQDAPPPESSPTDSFCLVVIDVDEVDYLHLKKNVRWEYKSTEEDGKRIWTSLEVNP